MFLKYLFLGFLIYLILKRVVKIGFAVKSTGHSSANQNKVEGEYVDYEEVD